MEYTKKWWQSKGIWGSLIAGFAGIWAIIEQVHAFVDANPNLEKGFGALVEVLQNNPADVVVIVGAFIAWIGRWKGDKIISNDLI